jgi:hypothetical protein
MSTPRIAAPLLAAACLAAAGARPVLAQAPGSAAGMPAQGAAAAPAPFARPTEAELQEITDSGRRIAVYHEAVTKTRAALSRQRPEIAEARGVVVDFKGATHVYFFRKDEAGGSMRGWILIADAVYQPRAGEVGATVFPDPAKAPPVDAIQALRAIEAARGSVSARPGGPPAPWDEAAFKEKTGGAWMVTLQTRPERADSARFGADARFRISGDGMQVGDMTALHTDTTTVAVPARPGASPTLHSHSQGDLPTDTDVAVVLDHPSLAPHLILTPRHMFRIEADGRINYLGPNSVPPAAPGGGR